MFSEFFNISVTIYWIFRSLDLSHNQVTDIEDTSFQSLTSLQILKIQHNRIASLGEDFSSKNQ